MILFVIVLSQGTKASTALASANATFASDSTVIFANVNESLVWSPAD